jgi:hypothetical protein
MRARFAFAGAPARNTCWCASLEHSKNKERRIAESAANPKLDPHPGSNTEKDPDDWVSGDEPMTGAQPRI